MVMIIEIAAQLARKLVLGVLVRKAWQLIEIYIFYI
jgi:hypothetical protein